MIDSNTDFFKIVDNFAKTAHVPSIPIIEAKLDFVPKVTIAIPTYKRPDLLKDALESALNQVGYDEYDVMVVDNNPERNCETEKLIYSYSDKRLSYYKNAENLGMEGNWNRLFTFAKGPWVVMLHDDDLLLPDFIRVCMSIVFKHPNIGILKPLQYEWYDDGKKLKLPGFTCTKKLKRIYEIDNLRGFVLGPPTGLLLNKEKVHLIGGFNSEMHPSSDFCFIVLFSYFFQVYQIDQVLSIYRWMQNESLKAATLQGFINNDYHLYSYLFKHFKFPNKLSENILNFKFMGIEELYRKIDENLKFDIKILGMQSINPKVGLLSYYLLRCIILLFRFVYACGGKLIFKKRQFNCFDCF